MLKIVAIGLPLIASAALAVGLAPTTAAPAAALAAAATAMHDHEWKVDAVHSSVVFRVKHLNTAWFYGRFNQIDGSVVLDENDPSKSSIKVTIPVNSVDSNSDKRDGHLKGEDFFAASEFPSATFVSKSWTKKTDNVWSVTGDFTLRGVTKPITVDIEKTGASDTPRFGKRVGLETTFTINRLDYGVNYMPEGLSPEVRITVAIELMK